MGSNLVLNSASNPSGCELAAGNYNLNAVVVGNGLTLTIDTPTTVTVTTNFNVQSGSTVTAKGSLSIFGSTLQVDSKLSGSTLTLNTTTVNIGTTGVVSALSTTPSTLGTGTYYFDGDAGYCYLGGGGYGGSGAGKPPAGGVTYQLAGQPYGSHSNPVLHGSNGGGNAAGMLIILARRYQLYYSRWSRGWCDIS